MVITSSIIHRIIGWNFYFLVFAPTLICSLKGDYLNSQNELPDDRDQIGIHLNGRNEIAHVTFMTRLRHKRDLTEREFHIIQIFIPSRNTTTLIHLARKDAIVSSNLKVTIRNGDDLPEIFTGEENESDCLYHGSISSGMGGQAALSACGGHFGFSGLIISGEEHLLIEPHFRPVDVKSFEKFVKVPHVIRRRETTQESQCKSHERRISRRQLQKSQELNKLAWKKSKNEIENVDEYLNISGPQKSTTDSLGSQGQGEIWNEKVFGKITTTLNLKQTGTNPQKGKAPSTVPKKGVIVKLGQNPKVMGSNQASYEKGVKSKPTIPKGGKNSIPSSAKKIVEIAIFTDPDFYNRLQKSYPDNSMSKIKTYVLTLLNSMDLLYEQPSLGTKLNFRLVHLEIQTKWPNNLKNPGEAGAYLNKFCIYAGDLNKENKLWDHALMLTGSDLRGTENEDYIGLAWGGTMCYRYYSCSVSEGIPLGVVYTIAHEIGHGLGMEHDGDPINAKCPKDKFLMSPTSGSGEVTWSTCSAKNLKQFLAYGTSNSKERAGAKLPKCLLKSAKQSKTIPYSSKGLPGQKYNASTQCQLALGKNFKPLISSKAPYNNICFDLYCCDKPDCHNDPIHPALEGTTCGSGKICRRGKCVK